MAGRYPRPCENTMIHPVFHTRFGPGPQPGPPDPRGASSTLWLWEPVGDKSRSPAPPQGPSPPCMAPSVPTSTAPGPPPWRGDAGGLLGASGSGGFHPVGQGSVGAGAAAAALGFLPRSWRQSAGWELGSLQTGGSQLCLLERCDSGLTPRLSYTGACPRSGTT